nr:MOSC and Molybdenum cofactor sulfurase domain containing protein [Haemonchus contortus]
MIEDKKLLIAIVGTSIIAYNGVRYLLNYFRSRRSSLIPIGTVGALYVYPVKSCKGKSVFSVYCDELGPVAGEMRDRQFVVINGETGRFWTATSAPCMVLIDCEVRDGVLTMSYVDGSSVKVILEDVVKRNDVRTARVYKNERCDGLDCGDDAATFLSNIIQDSDARLLMYVDGLFTERARVTTPTSWYEDAPSRKDKLTFNDDAPFMINTQSSLDDLNRKLHDKVTIEQFRPVIVVNNCDAFDEDKWYSVHIGDVALQCTKPCERCVMTTINSTTGMKHPSLEPLKTLRKYRLAPEGPMRELFKDCPIFGVDAGVITPGYIHVGQTVYVRYKRAYQKASLFHRS